jgi:hypothetical protein
MAQEKYQYSFAVRGEDLTHLISTVCLICVVRRKG